MKPGYVGLDDNGSEVLDDTPVAIPVRFQRQPTILQEILDTRNLIRNEMSRMAAEEGNETFEEADDFYIVGEDDLDPYSPHELSAINEDNNWHDFRDQFGPQGKEDTPTETRTEADGDRQRGREETSEDTERPSKGRKTNDRKHGKRGSSSPETDVTD